MRSANTTSFKKGQTAWNKGKKWSDETRKRQSEARYRFYAGGGKHPLEGKKRPDITGEKNPNWKQFGRKHPKWTDDKKRPFYKSIRQLFKYVEWRTFIFTRDNFTCVLCKATGYIEADHFPIRFVDILKQNDIKDIDQALNCKELWDTENGRTLCKPCHLKTLTWGNTKGLEKKAQNGLI